MDSLKHHIIADKENTGWLVPTLDEYPDIYTVDLASGEHAHYDDVEDNDG